MSAGLPIKSGIVLWLLAPGLLWLSVYRPYGDSSGRAAQLPMAVRGYTAEGEELNDQHRALLGTDDAVYRRYEDGEGHRVWVTCVFHEANWKSVHPPHICLEGSNMAILEDGSSTFAIAGDEVTVGRIVAHAHDANASYVSLFLFVAPEFRSPSYGEFFWHHLPKALLRRATSGFLLRVDTYVGPDGSEAAESRCREVMGVLLPAGEKML